MANKSTNSEVAVLQTQVENMSKDLVEVKGYLQDLIKKVDDLALAQTEISELRNEINTLKAEVEELKGTNSLKNTLLWVGLVASAIINIVVIYQLFSGDR